MRSAAILFFLAVICSAMLAFMGPWQSYPSLAQPYSITAYQIAGFLFWMFFILFLISLFGLYSARRKSYRTDKLAQKEIKESSRVWAEGISISFFLFGISLISGIFGFGFVASTLVGLALVIFWISLFLALISLIFGLIDYYH